MGTNIGYYDGDMFDREDLSIIRGILLSVYAKTNNYKVGNIIYLIDTYLERGI